MPRLWQAARRHAQHGLLLLHPPAQNRVKARRVDIQKRVGHLPEALVRPGELRLLIGTPHAVRILRLHRIQRRCLRR